MHCIRNGSQTWPPAQGVVELHPTTGGGGSGIRHRFEKQTSPDAQSVVSAQVPPCGIRHVLDARSQVRPAAHEFTPNGSPHRTPPVPLPVALQVGGWLPIERHSAVPGGHWLTLAQLVPVGVGVGFGLGVGVGWL